jgi:hypothetical protein
MINHKTLRQIAACGVSLPTFAASPSVAKATVYMPSKVAAELFRRPSSGVYEQRNGRTIGSEQSERRDSAA